jgi:hypothetical protein
VPQTKAALFARDGHITLRTVLGKFFCTSATLASGIPLGREGPSVQVGSGIASVLGRLLGLRTEQVKKLIPVGAAAAIAAAFNTPLAAVLFSLEEIVGDLHAPVMGAVVLASATAWMVLRVSLGEGRNLIRLETENPFGAEPSGPDIVRFVSILSRAGRLRATLPVTFPPDGEWLVRVIASNKQFVFGMYRRHMKTISYLGQIDKLFGMPATTRNWNTILAVLRLLKDGEKKTTDSPRTT